MSIMNTDLYTAWISFTLLKIIYESQGFEYKHFKQDDIGVVLFHVDWTISNAYTVYNLFIKKKNTGACTKDFWNNLNRFECLKRQRASVTYTQYVTVCFKTKKYYTRKMVKTGHFQH